MFKRIVSLALALVICAYVSILPVQALTWDDVTESFAYPVDFLTLFWHSLTHSDFLTWFDHSEDDPGSLMFYYIYSPLNCPENPNKDAANDDFAFHDFGGEYNLKETLEGDLPCIYCGMTFDQYREAVAAERDLWESDLPDGLIATDEDVKVYGKGFYKDSSECLNVNDFWAKYNLKARLNGNLNKKLLFGYSRQNNSAYSCYIYLSTAKFAGSGSVGIFESSGLLPDGYTATNYPFGDLVSLSSSSDGFTNVFYSYDDALMYYTYSGSSSDLYFLTQDSYLEFPNTIYHEMIFKNVGRLSSSGVVTYGVDFTRPIRAGGTLELFYPRSYSVADEYTEDSRPVGIMDAIQQYNVTNNYITNNNVNYYIGSFDEDDDLTGYYPMDIYDEQTMVFTEPVTGAQYQSTGWKYDYASRSYLINLASGTFRIGDYDILQIRLTYGDEAVTIQYYNQLGELVEMDEYQYIVVAQQECTLTGHTYDVETVKDATCTSTGERRYTCSVCGDQKIEDIPMTAHTSTYSEFKPASCTDPGVAIYTCSTCSTQYTEQIPALGHDWLSVEDVETVMTLPAGAACPECSGSDFTAVLDQAAAVFACNCNSCGAVWSVPADVTVGYTKYECSRCGLTKQESDASSDGLFSAIGNLIADGLIWCTEKLTQLVDNLTQITDTFSLYLTSLADKGGLFPSFLGAVLDTLPEELTALLWLSLIGLVALAVFNKWFR